MNPTDVLAIAPAIRFPGTLSFTKVDRFVFVVLCAAVGILVDWKKGRYDSSVRIDERV